MTEKIVALVLAGGRSSRMGRDKALIEIGGRTMLDRACDLAQRCGADEVIVLGRPDHPLGIADQQPFKGPAKAIAAWLENQTKPLKLIVLPIDMPLLSPIHINALNSAGHGGFFDDMYLPFVACVTDDLDLKGDRIRELLSALKLQPVPVPEEWVGELENFNDPATLEKLNVKQ